MKFLLDYQNKEGLVFESRHTVIPEIVFCLLSFILLLVFLFSDIENLFSFGTFLFFMIAEATIYFICFHGRIKVYVFDDRICINWPYNLINRQRVIHFADVEKVIYQFPPWRKSYMSDYLIFHMNDGLRISVEFSNFTYYNDYIHKLVQFIQDKEVPLFTKKGGRKEKLHNKKH